MYGRSIVWSIQLQDGGHTCFHTLRSSDGALMSDASYSWYGSRAETPRLCTHAALERQGRIACYCAVVL